MACKKKHSSAKNPRYGSYGFGEKNYIGCKKAIRTLQSWFKLLRAKRELKVLFAVIVLQRSMRRFIIRWRTRYYIRYYIKLQDVIKVQAHFRGIKTRRKLTEDHFAMVISKAQHMYHMGSSLIPDIKAKGSLFHSTSIRKSKFERKIVSKALKKQLYEKARKVRLSYELMREGAKRIQLYKQVTVIQAKCRGFMARKKYLVKLSMIVIIQKYVRKWVNHSTIQRRKNAIVVMQGFVGIVKLRVKFKTIVRGMVRLQSKYRMAKEKNTTPLKC